MIQELKPKQVSIWTYIKQDIEKNVDIGMHLISYGKVREILRTKYLVPNELVYPTINKLISLRVLRREDKHTLCIVKPTQ